MVTNIPLWWGMLILGEAVHGEKGGNIWEISILSTQFCCGLKTTLKKIIKSLSIYIYSFKDFQDIYSGLI